MSKNNELLKELADKYSLTGEHFFKSPQGWIIITRNGIDKIQAEAGIDISYETVSYDPANKAAAVKAIGILGDQRIETYGEAASDNCRQAYKLAMAEKRAMSRIVLKLTGFYAAGAYGVDESDDFATAASNHRKSGAKGGLDLIKETLSGEI